MIRISVIIPTFNRGELFTECIQSVLQSIGPDDEVIVVNDSKTNSLHLNSNDTRVRVFDNPKSGVASARNLGASHAKGEYLLFIDDDMIINAEAINSCYELILEEQEAVIHADWIYPPEELIKNRLSAFGRYLEHIRFTSLKGWCPDLQWVENGIVTAKGITSQFLLISKALFHSINGYNESFPFAGFEDYDLGKRLEASGVKSFINTRCCIYHNERDRMQLEPFLTRKKRGAYTRKKGFEIGHSELEINFSGIKKKYLQCSFLVKPVFAFLIKLIPNSKITDPVYRFLANRLVGIAIYEGYSKKHNL